MTSGGFLMQSDCLSHGSAAKVLTPKNTHGSRAVLASRGFHSSAVRAHSLTRIADATVTSPLHL